MTFDGFQAELAAVFPETQFSTITEYGGRYTAESEELTVTAAPNATHLAPGYTYGVELRVPGAAPIGESASTMAAAARKVETNALSMLVGEP